MANTITLLRLPFLAAILGLLFWAGPTAQLVCVPLILILILMDSLDGYIARRQGETSLLGSALDIAVDRIVELVLWVSFSALSLIPLVIPLVVITRGTLTDAVRAVASSRGVRAYDMLRSPLANFLVASAAMRTSYGIAKGFAFCLLALTLGLENLPAGDASLDLSRVGAIVKIAGLTFSWLSLALCLARGLPVLIEAPGYFKTLDQDGISN